MDREEDQSICKLDTNEAITIRELLARRGTEIRDHLGLKVRFPILIKWLDCQERLSLQVHLP